MKQNAKRAVVTGGAGPVLPCPVANFVLLLGYPVVVKAVFTIFADFQTI